MALQSINEPNKRTTRMYQAHLINCIRVFNDPGKSGLRVVFLAWPLGKDTKIDKWVKVNMNVRPPVGSASSFRCPMRDLLFLWKRVLE